MSHIALPSPDPAAPPRLSDITHRLLTIPRTLSIEFSNNKYHSRPRHLPRVGQAGCGDPRQHGEVGADVDPGGPDPLHGEGRRLKYT